jgi:hypothetical protein
MKRFSAILAAFALSACGGTTGGGLVSFPAFASGPSGVAPGYTFQVGFGYTIKLATAKMHIGAVYLTASIPVNSVQSCIEPGRYVAEVTGPIDVDVLSDAPQAFTVQGDGTEDQAHTAEVWLTGGNVNATLDPTVIVTVTGTASRSSGAFRNVPFQASVTISDNRELPVSDPSQPGLNPICKRRIVSGILVDTMVAPGSALYVEIDPAAWFNAVNFSQLDPVMTGTVAVSPPRYQIPDTDFGTTRGQAAGRNLFLGLTANSGVYSFGFHNP